MKNFIISIFLFLLSIFTGIILCETNKSIKEKTCKVKDSLKDKVSIKPKPQLKVSYTVYNCVSAQCDDSPLITSDLSKIDTNKLNKGLIKWIAISRNLEKEFPMGTKVRVSKGGKFNGVWVIHDKMNKRFKDKIDFLVPNKIKLGKGYCIIEKI